MSENKVESKSNADARVGRRGFFRGSGKLALGAVAGLATTGVWAAKEVEIGKEGIHTSSGIFYPLYETHDVGRNIDDVQQHLDGYFNEDRPRFDLDPTKEPERFLVFNNKTSLRPSLPGESEDSSWPTNLLGRIAKDRAQIILGDIIVPEVFRDRRSHFNTDVERFKSALGLSLAGATTAVNILERKSTRRNFLVSSVAWAAGIVLTVPWAAKGPAYAAIELDPEQKAAATRVLTRVHGLASHLAPENPMIFLRNLMMANNLLLAAGKIKEHKNSLPKIAFNQGAGHAGTEDLLRVGPDFIRWLINLYPDWYLEQVVDLNGGLEDFCSARMLTLPQNFTGQKEDYGRIVDQQITDGTLLIMLQQKLPEYAVKEKAERKREVTKLSELCHYYTSSDISAQVSSILDNLVASKKDFRKYLKVSKYDRFSPNTTRFTFELTLPNFTDDKSFSNDITAEITVTPEGRITSEEIRFFLDTSGHLTRYSERWTTVFTSKDKLRETLNRAIPLAKDPPGKPYFVDDRLDQEGWLYHMSPDFAEQSVGLAGFFEEGGVRRELRILNNGEVIVRVYVDSREAEEKDGSTRPPPEKR